jgi:hypothetical protein
MVGRFLRICSIAALFLATGAEAKGPYGHIKIGLWAGGAYTNDTTNTFSHCAAGASYVSGIYFMVSMDASESWTLAFAHESWHLQVGEAFPIDLTFDGQAPTHVFGRALTGTLVQVPMPAASALMAQFRKASMMSALAKGQLFQFKLDGTAQLIPTLANCVASVKAKGVTNVGDFTIAPAPRPVGGTPSAAGSHRADVADGTQAELQIEAIELASNFIIKTALQNPRVLSRAETPAALASASAAWQSDEASGFVRIIPTQPGTKGLDVTAAVIASDAKECKGKFASARKSELVDSDVVFEGMMSCEDSDGARLAHYFLVPRGKGGFVIFAVVSNMKNALAQKVTKDEKLVDFRKAALVVVTR